MGGGGEGGGQCGVVFCMARRALSYYHRYEASEIWKLSRKLPADFQELPLSAVTRLVVLHDRPSVVSILHGRSIEIMG